MSTRLLAVPLVAAAALLACGETPPPKDTTQVEKPADSAAAVPSASVAAVPASAASAVPAAPALPFACDGAKLHTAKKEYCLSTGRRSFDQAAAECERMHGRLAVLSDAEEAKNVTSQLVSPWGYGSGMWLGCSDEESEGKWKCDGKPLTYKNWVPGKPDNETALEDCQQWLADSGQWNDTSCSVPLGYICRGDAKMQCATGHKITAGKAVFCAHGDDVVDWDGARKACAKTGGKLAVLATAEESQALFAALKQPLSIPSSQPTEGVWIGLTDQKDEGKFRWSDETPMSYGNWLPKQPDDSNGGEDCATLTLGDGRWNDVDCIRALPFLCEAR